MSQRKGITKVFLSSTFRDLHGMRGYLLDRLDSALDAAAMEKFISRGEGPHTDSLRELKDSDISLFLISSYYGTNIQNCEFTRTCRADCEMKTGKENISYTWCEYRVTKAEEKLHSTYIIDEAWPSKDGAPVIWKMREEVEQETCPRIQNNDEGVERVVCDLAQNIIEWYATGKIDFGNFCGRRSKLRELFSKMKRSVNVHGVGGIGKTTLCEVALLIYKLLGRKIVYVGSREAYASGTGYEFASEKLTPRRVLDLTLDDIIDALQLGDPLKRMDQNTKVNAVLQFLDTKGAILFIDDFREDEGLRELIMTGSNLDRGCILVSTKKELKTFYRVSVESIEEEERGKLISIMAGRMGKEIGEKERKTIERIGEGHPIATYLLVSNAGRVSLERLESFKEGLDFSQDDDVMEYMNRVIKNSVSSEAYHLLKQLSVLEEQIDMESIRDTIAPLSMDLFGEFIDVFLERDGDVFVWKYNQIKEAVFEDTIDSHRMAAQYYRRKLERYERIEDEIRMLYHYCKVSYSDKILFSFVEIANSLREEDPRMRLLPEMGEEIKKHVEKGKRALVCGTLGDIYGKISNFRDKAVNCRKAIEAYKEALRVRSYEKFPMDYATTQNNLGNALGILAEVEEKAANCRKAIEAYKEALRIYSYEEFPIQFAATQNNLGAALQTLAEVEEKAANCRKAIEAHKEALRIYSYEEFPIQFAATQNNLGNALGILAEVEEKAANCRKAIDAYKEALRIYS